MRLILDSCTLIYLTKANLFHEFMKLTKKAVFIDKEVYTEVIEQGKEKNYPDAIEVENYLIEYKIPIIPTDIKKYIHYFRDKGETSCFILAQENGICITSDRKAYNKFRQRSIKVQRIDTYFYQEGIRKRYSKDEIAEILEKLLINNATTPERYATIMKNLIKEGENVI